jgi:hypothetical protein
MLTQQGDDMKGKTAEPSSQGHMVTVEACHVLTTALTLDLRSIHRKQ